MGRRKRRIIKTVKRTLPKVYGCPQCGTISVKVMKEENLAKIVCGSCGLIYKYKLNTKKPNIDIYNEFIDKYISGRLNSK